MTLRLRRHGLVLLALAVGFVIGGATIGTVSARRELLSYLDLFNDALAKVEGTYVEEIDEEEIIYGAIRGMLSSLDPYSMFLDEETFTDFTVTTEGEFGGLGIQITVRDGVLTVVSPIEGTPAYDLGIQSGDRIIAIEGESTRGITVDEAIGKLRGEPGTSVGITIRREGLDGSLDYTVTRDIIRIESVPYAFMMEGNVGYVRIARFSRTTATELRTELERLRDEGMERLVLDLRSNPGGLLSEAVDVSDIFLDTGELIVSTRGRISEQNQEFYARTPAMFDSDFPIVVLQNGGSASASEILAGSLQDWDRGLVVGTTSFGKGSVQTLMRLRPLTKGCAMKITTAKWYIASGRAIEKPERWADDLDEEETASTEGLPEYRTAGGRLVYGGGGVTPDVAIDFEPRADIVVDLERREEFFEFAIQYTAKHAIESIDFEVTEPMWDAFVEFLGRDDFDFDEEALARNRDEIELAIRRDLIRKSFGRKEAYTAAVKGDDQLERTIDLAASARTVGDLFRLAETYAEAE